MKDVLFWAAYVLIAALVFAWAADTGLGRVERYERAAAEWQEARR